MPNWVENILIIKGFNNQNEVDEFKEKAKTKEEEFQLKKFIPMPIAIKYDYNQKDEWHAWSLANWGIKWDLSSTALDHEDDFSLEYFFNTPWSPPMKALQKISEEYKHLIFLLKYEETGEGYIGISKFEKGKVEDYSITY